MYWKSKRAAILDGQGALTGEIGFLRDLFPHTGWPAASPSTISAPRTAGGELVNAVWIEPPAYDPATQELADAALYLDGAVAREHTVANLSDASKLASAAAVKIAAIKAAAATKIAAGFTYNAKVYQIDDTSQVHMTSTMADFNAGTANAHGGYWRSASNENVAMTDAECIAFLRAAKVYKMGVIRNAQTLASACLTAADQAALDAIDITTGWPA